MRRSHRAILVALPIATLLAPLACASRDGEADEGGGSANGESTSHAHDDESSSGAEPGSASEGTESDGADAAQDTGGPECGSGGSFDTRFTVLEDECESAAFIGYRDVMTIEVQGNGPGEATVAIVTDPGLEPVEGGVGEGCELLATGNGTVAAYPDTQVEWEGVLEPAGIIGTLTLGANGRLPGGCVIVYAVEPK